MNLSDRLGAMPVYERCSVPDLSEVRKMPGRSGGIWPAGSAGAVPSGSVLPVVPWCATRGMIIVIFIIVFIITVVRFGRR